MTFIYFKLRWSELNIIDIYFGFIGLYFGVYPFVKAVLENYSKANALAIFLVFLQIIIVLGILFVLVRCLPGNMRKVLEIKSLIGQWGECNIYLVFMLIATILMVQLIGYGKYGIISHVNQEEMARVGNKLPYWYSSALFLINDLILCAFIALVAKITVSKDSTRKWLIIPLLILVASASIYGRRFIINLAVMGTVLWFVGRGKDIFQLKYLKIVIALAVVLFIFSNIFQFYRGVLQFPPSITSDQLKNPFSAMFNANATFSNIRERPATWEFNYLIVESQITGKGVDFPRGAIIWQGLKNSIPGIFWTNKVVRSLNDMAANLYGFPAIDYGKNNFAFTQADFGYFSIIIMPLGIMAVFLTLILIVTATKENLTLLLILSGVVINYLINIEQNVADIFIMYRNLILFTGIYLVGSSLVRIKYVFKRT